MYLDEGTVIALSLFTIFIIMVVAAVAIFALVQSMGSTGKIKRLENAIAQSYNRIFELERSFEQATFESIQKSSESPIEKEDLVESEETATATQPTPMEQSVALEGLIDDLSDDLELEHPAFEQTPQDELIAADEPLQEGETFTLEVDNKTVEFEPVETTPSPDESMVEMPIEPVRSEISEPIQTEAASEESSIVFVQKEQLETERIEREREAKAERNRNRSELMKKISDVNIFAKIGLGVLFIGLAFFLKYAVDHDVFSVPIELKVAAVGAVGIGITFIGWRLRNKNANYSQWLQGGGVAITYLTIFSAYRLFEILPSLPAFALMLIVGIAMSALAVLQDSKPLAILSITGGFLVPILTSTDNGSHVALFGYYLILNVAIFALTNFKPWRMLTNIGFYFTFIIATFWGVTSYDPAKFASTEPFLITYWILYIGIALFYAYRQPPKLRGATDGTLLFGVPIVAFALQTILIKDIEFGIAFSALIAAIVYMGLALMVWKKRDESLRALSESFLAMAVIFGTIAIPFALDSNLTATAWAIEGAGIIWVSLRHDRKYARYFGVFIQYIGLLSFLIGVGTEEIEMGDQLFLNGFTLGAVMVSLAMFLTSYWLRGRKSFAGVVLLITAWIGLLLAGTTQIVVHHIAPDIGLATESMVIWLIGFYALYSLLAMIIGRQLKWNLLVTTSLTILPIIPLAYLLYTSGLLYYNYSFNTVDLLFKTRVGGTIILSIVSWYIQLTITPKDSFFGKINHWLHIVTALFVTALITREGWIALTPHFGETSLWRMAYLPTVSLMVLWFIMKAPLPLFKRYEISFGQVVSGTLFSFIALWSVIALGFSGTTESITYIPVINPLDIIQIISLITLVFWWRKSIGKAQGWELSALLTFLFVWGNAIVLRSVASYLDIPYQPEAFLVTSLAECLPFLPIVSLLMVWFITKAPKSILGRFNKLFLTTFTWILLLFTLLWSLIALFFTGVTGDSNYIPFVNPLEFVQIFTIVTLIFWWRQSKVKATKAVAGSELTLISGLIFLVANAVVLRMISSFADVTYRPDALFMSSVVQSSITIFWTLYGTVYLIAGSRLQKRSTWITGASLLGIVTIKLLFDLVGDQSVSRIVTFIVVGVIFMLVGYFSPYPKEKEQNNEFDTNQEIE